MSLRSEAFFLEVRHRASLTVIQSDPPRLLPPEAASLQGHPRQEDHSLYLPSDALLSLHRPADCKEGRRGWEMQLHFLGNSHTRCFGHENLKDIFFDGIYENPQVCVCVCVCVCDVMLFIRHAFWVFFSPPFRAIWSWTLYVVGKSDVFVHLFSFQVIF